MTNEEAIKIIETEYACVLRAEDCDRDCSNCDLLLDSGDILDAYSRALSCLSVFEYLEGLDWRKDRSMINRKGKCFLFPQCPFLTATCSVLGPDNGCYVYRAFEKMIEEDKNSKKEDCDDEASGD